VTRPLPRNLGIASAIFIALVAAIAPQVHACKNNEKSQPCSTPLSSESDASLMFAASSPSTSIPDLNSDAATRTPPVPFGPENVVRPVARQKTPKTTSRAAATSATKQVREPAARPTAQADPKHTTTPEPASSRFTASAPRASESASRTIVSRPHRMPSPEIF